LSEATLAVAFDSMRREDLPEVLAIESLSFSEPWTEEMFLHEISAQALAHVLVARADEGSGPRIVGFLCGWIVAGELHINNIAVHPGYRRRGVASQLLEEMLRRAKVMGAKAGYLEVRASNEAANALYQRYGFRQIGRRRNYYDHPREDAIIMGKKRL
jgi:ribosomal-protein-alanine N-acetyltransferase